jgi:hypothetical protein
MSKSVSWWNRLNPLIARPGNVHLPLSLDRGHERQVRSGTGGTETVAASKGYGEGSHSPARENGVRLA